MDKAVIKWMERIIKHYGANELKDVAHIKDRIERYKNNIDSQQESIKALEEQLAEAQAVIKFVKQLKKKCKDGKL